MMRCYNMAGPSEFSQLGKGSAVPADFKGVLVTTNERKWGRPTRRYVYATSLTLRDKPSVSGKKLGELKFNQLIPDAQFVGVSADKKYAWGHSDKLGGYFMWMEGDPKLELDAISGKVKGKWKVYLTSRGQVGGSELSATTASKSTPEVPPKAGLSATTASQEIPLPPKDETLVPQAKAQEQEVEIEQAGMSTPIMLGLLAVAAGAFLLLRKKG